MADQTANQRLASMTVETVSVGVVEAPEGSEATIYMGHDAEALPVSRTVLSSLGYIQTGLITKAGKLYASLAVLHGGKVVAMLHNPETGEVFRAISLLGDDEASEPAGDEG